MWNISFIFTHSQNTQSIKNAQPEFPYNVKALKEIAQDKELLQQFSVMDITFIQRNQVSLTTWFSYVTHLITNLIQYSPSFQLDLLWINHHNITTQVQQQCCTYFEENLPTSWKLEIIFLNGEPYLLSIILRNTSYLIFKNTKQIKYLIYLPD